MLIGFLTPCEVLYLVCSLAATGSRAQLSHRHVLLSYGYDVSDMSGEKVFEDITDTFVDDLSEIVTYVLLTGDSRENNNSYVDNCQHYQHGANFNPKESSVKERQESEKIRIKAKHK